MHPRRILIIDDEPGIRSLLADALRLEGCAVTTVRSGNEALTILRKMTFDVIISDIRMNDGNGIEFLSKFCRRQDGVMQVIMISGFSDYSETEVLHRGADHFVAKPFELEALVELALNGQPGH